MFNTPLALNDTQACLVYMPEGVHEINATVDGKPARQRVIVDRSCLDGLSRDLNAMLAAGKARPVCYFDHKAGSASFIPTAFDYQDGVGVLLKGEWTGAGQKAVSERNYSYFSPNFVLNRATCKPSGLDMNTVEVGSLVNDPAFETIARIAASKATLEDFTIFDDIGEDTESVKPETKHNTHMLEKLIKLGILSAEEAQGEHAEEAAEAALKALLDKAKGADVAAEKATEAEKKAVEAEKKAEDDKKEADAKLACARADLKKAQDELATVKAAKADLIDAEIEAAVKAGKIAPQDEDAKAALKSALTANIKAGKALIAGMQANPAFATVVAGKSAAVNDELTGRDRVAAEIAKELNR